MSCLNLQRVNLGFIYQRCFTSSVLFSRAVAEVLIRLLLALRAFSFP